MFHIRLLTTTESNHPTSPTPPPLPQSIQPTSFESALSFTNNKIHLSHASTQTSPPATSTLLTNSSSKSAIASPFLAPHLPLLSIHSKGIPTFYSQLNHLQQDGGHNSLERLNKVVEILCSSKLVVEAKYLVLKLNEWIKPNGITYGWLIKGFCDVGDLIEASKIWNVMVDEGFISSVDVVDKMIETFFRINKYEVAMKVFQMMTVKRMDELGLSTYRLVINWMCKRGKISQAYVMFKEMLKRGIEADNLTLSYVIYGLLARGKVREAYKVVGAVEKPDISVYHGLIKGLLKLRRASEATQVFREMIKRGCEPTMHTYIMLLQGHLGKRGRKGVDPLVNFDTIFVGGLVKAGKSLEATKYMERVMNRGVEVPRFDYNKFLHYYSNEEGVAMFEEVGKKLREVGLVDLADILKRYEEKMATRERRRDRADEP
ncbi:hypothetical protein Pint_31860 [Pistacia integerrima]|uniref:Uncharacterized protein n=1 Tax=Pistacia integerrima TaxID=434235 RepID=A0ACC0XRL7_9ROSI|nr:hypothetical protein Pint_31860 [Pistacia integerrima]